MKRQRKQSCDVLSILMAGLCFSLLFLVVQKPTCYVKIENIGLVAGLFVAEWFGFKQVNLLISVFDLVLVSLVVVTILVIVVLLWRKVSRQWKSSKENQKELENIMSHIPLPVLIVNKENELRMMNQAAVDLFHCTNKALLTGFKSTCDSLAMSDELKGLLQKLDKKEGQATIELKNHGYKVDIAKIQLPHHTMDEYIVVLQDVTQAMNMQSKLEEKSIELETISENLIGGILVTELDDQFTVIRSNPGYLELIGLQEDEIKGKNAMEWVALEDIDFVRETILSHLHRNEPVNIEHRIHRKNKEKIWVSLYGKKTILKGHEVGIWMIVDINQRKETQQQSMINEERYRIALENTEDIILEYDVKTKSMYHSLKVTEVYGVDQVILNAPESIPQSGVIDSMSIDDFLNSLNEIEKGKPQANCILKTVTKDKQILWKRLILTNIFNEDKLPERAIGILQDITREQEANLQYQKEVHYREVTMRDHALYYEVDITHRQFIKGHEALTAKVLGHVENDYDLVTEALLDSFVYKADKEEVGRLIASDYLLNQVNLGKTKVEFEYRRMQDEKSLWVICTLYLLVEEGAVKALCYIKDNDEAKLKELALKQKAEKDLLSGLYNKVTTENKIDEWLSENPECLAALFLIDLDNFKNVNDTLGHAFGDAVLSEVSRKIAACFLECDLCGRIGGDEFIVFLTQSKSLDQIMNQVEHLCKELSNSYGGHSQMQQISISVGVAIAPKDGSNFLQLYQKSDIALYHSKNQGKNRFSVYCDELPKMDGHTNGEVKQIDENSGKSFYENIVEYVLRILYGAPDPMFVIPGILELVAKNYGYSRSYLFELLPDNRQWKRSQEWCAEGIGRVRYDDEIMDEEGLKKYRQYFDQDDIFFARNTQDLASPYKEYFAKKHVVSLIQFVVMDKGVAKAMIGFEDCQQPRLYEDKEIQPLHMIAMLIATALLNYKKK